MAGSQTGCDGERLMRRCGFDLIGSTGKLVRFGRCPIELIENPPFE